MLKKKLEDAEKAKDQAEQDGYNVGVVETEEALRAEVSGVCRAYCLQVWIEALNLARVEASLALKRAENEYYPLVIQASGSSTSQDDAALNVISPIKEVLTKDPPPPSCPQKGVEQTSALDKEKEGPKEVASEITKPLDAPKDSSKGGVVSQSHKLVLETFPIPPRKNPKVRVWHPWQQQPPNLPRLQKKNL